MSELFTRHESTKKPAIVVRRILDLIDSGALSPGDKLPPENEIVKQTEISRTSVREALSALELMGVIRRVPSEGTFITHESKHLFRKFSNIDILQRFLEDADNVNLSFEALETRMILEPSVATLAARRAEPGQIEKLEGILKEMEDAAAAKDVDTFLRHDSLFHLAVAEATNNDVILEISQIILKKADMNMWTRFTKDMDLFQYTIDSHTKILSAIKERDTKKAEFYAENHLSMMLRS